MVTEGAAALAEFPELRRLVDLRNAGWQFMPVWAEGELVEVRGVRTWPRNWVDAIAVRFTTDAAGLRCDPSGGVVWERFGNLDAVVEGLLTLPSPGDPAAPRQVLRAAPGWWTG